MRKIKNMFRKVLSTLTISSMILGTVAIPAIASKGDFYDLTTSKHYSVSSLTPTIKAEMNSAYANGHILIKEQAGGKFLNYRGAYEVFAQSFLETNSLSTALAVVKADTSLYPTINTDEFTEADADELSVTSINSINVTTVVGIFPILPSTVIATMSDGSNKTVNVTWDSVDSSKYENAGTFTLGGTIAESTIKAMANITVTNTVGSRGNPIKGYNDLELPFQRYSYEAERTINLSLIKYITGDTADSLVNEMNTFNDKPTSTQEWRLYTFNLTYVSGSEDDVLEASDVISESKFFLQSGSSLPIYNTATLGGSNKPFSIYDVELYPGGSSNVVYGILVDKTAETPIIKIPYNAGKNVNWILCKFEAI